MHIKEYLSYSQYTCFNKSPREYKRRYIDCVKEDNKWLRFGKKIAEGLEVRDEPAIDSDVAVARSLIEEPKEKELKLFTNFYDIPLYGILDGYNPREIREYKTGKNPWTQTMVDNAEQLTFYAILVSQVKEIEIEDLIIRLDWLKTIEDIDGEMCLAGEHKSFYTKRTTRDILLIYPKIKRTWDGIGELIDSLI